MADSREGMDYDVVVVGGAFSGASAALLIKRARPSCRVLIVERSEVFDRKVGESTSEVAGCFLTRVLGLGSYLGREHIVKHGLRMWFTDHPDRPLDECSEIGPHSQVRLPTYQVDRARLDEHLLATAVQEGCELWRPAVVRDGRERSADGGAAGEGGGAERHQLLVQCQGEERRVRYRWLVDASGRAAWLGRRHGDLQVLDREPTKSMWGRFRGVADLDGAELRQRHPAWASRVFCSRSAATNHLTGRGWWCWIIPLQDGDFSLGLTYDPRLFTPPEGGSIGERLLKHVRANPVGRELFARAEVVGRDTRAYGQLAYKVNRVAGPGWVIVGDAAGFMDPLYSQGLDYCAHTVVQASKVVLSGLEAGDEGAREGIERYNFEFNTSFDRWFDALYAGKYRYLGDAELMWAAFQLDLGAYFLGPVKFVYGDTMAQFARMPYDGRVGGWVARLMGFYNQRLGLIADKRWHAGRYGRWNHGRCLLIRGGFAPVPRTAGKFFLRGLWRWGLAELSALRLRRPPTTGLEPAVPMADRPAEPPVAKVAAAGAAPSQTVASMGADDGHLQARR